MRKEYVRERYGNEVYITEERWEHIQQEHPDMNGYYRHLLETLRLGNRAQDDLEMSKYFYVKAFQDLVDYNNHIIVVVKFARKKDDLGREVPNNFVITAYQNFF